MNKAKTLCILFAVALALGACEGRTDKTDSGGVILSISDFDGLPIRSSVNSAGGLLQVEEFVIQNVPKNPSGVTSSLMNVELLSYEVEFSRADAGTKLPPPLVAGIFGVVPVDGTLTIENLDVMGIDQYFNKPLSDLLFENGGVDAETGLDRITLNTHLRFFGRTLSGDEVQSNTMVRTIEFVP